MKLLRSRQVYWPILVSASMVDGYLKYHNDRWYAALERALDRQIPFASIGRAELASRLLDDLKAAGVAPEPLSGSLELQRRAFTASGDELRELRSKDTFQYKPLSFYAGDEQLERIWVADRATLRTVDRIAPADIEALNGWWRQNDTEGHKALRSLRQVFARVTNRFDPALYSDNPLALLRNVAREERTCPKPPCATLWPPSSPGVLERMTADQRKPYDAAGQSQPRIDEIVAATKSGVLSMQPLEAEGFLIHQRYALESLLTFAQLPESAAVTPDTKIHAIWEEVFKAGTTKALDTHAKVMDFVVTSIGRDDREPPKPERYLLEPLPTLYLRYAQSYGFLLKWARTLPPSFAAAWTVDGMGILTYLEKLEREMLALYYLSIRQLGLAPDPAVRGQIESVRPDQLFKTGRGFLSELHKHPAMSTDQRVFVVQDPPGGTKAQGCNGRAGIFLVTLGVQAVPVELKPASAWHSTVPEHRMVILVDHSAQITACIDQPLTRAEWRKLLADSEDFAEVKRRLEKEY